MIINQAEKKTFLDYSLHGIIWLGSSGFRIFLLNRSIAVRGSFLTMLSRKADHLHFLKNYKRLRLTLYSKTTTYRHFATIMCASSTLYLVFTGGIQKGICDKTKYLKYYVLQMCYQYFSHISCSNVRICNILNPGTLSTLGSQSFHYFC